MSSSSSPAAPPLAAQVQKVEPPNWWIRLRPQVMLLLTGEGLHDAMVAVTYPGVSVSRQQAEADGRHIFVWLNISESAQAGNVPIEIRASSGTVVIPFPLYPRTETGKRFQGISQDDVVYLIMPDRFANGDPSNDQPVQSPNTHDRSKDRAYHGGDLHGIRQRLPYLRQLGVTTIWTTPVYDNDNHSPNDYHGYGAVDFYGVDEHLGTLKEYQELVSAAHDNGMKVFLDVVLNHTGPRHPWASSPPAPEWFHGTQEQHGNSDGDFGPLTDPHATPASYRNLRDGWFAGILPDLKQENPLVADYLLMNSIWWAESSGVDGFRLDTFPYLPREVWSSWHAELFKTYPHFSTIGEVFHRDSDVTSFFAGGRKQFDGVDSGAPTVFDFPAYFALRDVIIHGASVNRLVDVLQRDWMYPHPESLVTFIGNHDTRRFLTEAGGSREKLKMAYSLLLTLRGIPQIYAGDEIAMEGGEDPDNRRDFPGGFPGDARNAFEPSGRTAEEQDVFSHVQSLLRLRMRHPALRQGRQWNLTHGDDTLVFLRDTPGDSVLVAFNNSHETRSVTVPLRDTPLLPAKQLQLLSGSGSVRLQDGVMDLRLEPASVSIFQAR